MCDERSDRLRYRVLVLGAAAVAGIAGILAAWIVADRPDVRRAAVEPPPVPDPPPADAYEIEVIAKQWMWKFHHPGGRRETTDVHVPAGTAVKFVAVSEDVAHRFTVPGLGISVGAQPGVYTMGWTVPEKVGRYPFACTEDCGEHHALHKGIVVVMERADFDQWLAAPRGP
jgi:heme/copper-type cytochrome/quinol oxidase subunit 2